MVGIHRDGVCSVSQDPPLVLTCLADSANCAPAFASASRWAIHFVTPDDADLAVRFATRGADKFAGTRFATSERGLPVFQESGVGLECAAHARHEAGDHTILVGRVEQVHIGQDPPAVYFRRGFHQLVRSQRSSN